jgi:hypothetical protein
MSILHFYGELDEKEEALLEKHLGECEDCRRESDETRRLFRLLDENKEASVPEANWSSAWEKIETGIKEAPAGIKAHRWFPRWAYAAPALAAVLIAGILIGKLWRGPSRQERLAEPPGQVSYTAALKNHIEDIQPVLLEYAHSNSEKGGGKILMDKDVVRGLLLQNILMKRVIAGKDPSAAELLEDLDVVLREIANQDANDVHSLGLIKELIREREVLFRLEIMKKM